MTSKIQRGTTEAERAAVRGSGVKPPGQFDKESDAEKDVDVFTVAELAAQYVQLGGTDPRALKVVEAAKKAGHINEMGIYVGPSRNGPMSDQDKLLASGIDIDGCEELINAIANGDDDEGEED